MDENIFKAFPKFEIESEMEIRYLMCKRTLSWDS